MDITINTLNQLAGYLVKQYPSSEIENPLALHLIWQHPSSEIEEPLVGHPIKQYPSRVLAGVWIRTYGICNRMDLDDTRVENTNGLKNAALRKAKT